MKKLNTDFLFALFFGTLFILAAPAVYATDDEKEKDKKSDETEEADTLADTLVESEEVLSFDLVSFENEMIPVDRDLYEYHVSQLEFDIPMVYNQYVKRQIDYYGTDWQIKLKEMVTKSKYYFPLYEEILAQYDLPLELKYLSIIESGLNPYAKSRSGAVGLWQFMPTTGKFYDLEINYSIDERRSLEKSTHAACRYLKKMYGK